MPEVLALVHRKVREGGSHECIVFRVHRVKGGREERKMERGRESGVTFPFQALVGQPHRKKENTFNYAV